MANRTDQAPEQPSPVPIRIVEDVPPPPRTTAEEITYARAALEETGNWDRASHPDTRDAAVLLHFRLQRLLDALDGVPPRPAVTA